MNFVLPSAANANGQLGTEGSSPHPHILCIRKMFVACQGVRKLRWFREREYVSYPLLLRWGELVKKSQACRKPD
jgi:hypothetical protein